MGEWINKATHKTAFKHAGEWYSSLERKTFTKEEVQKILWAPKLSARWPVMITKFSSQTHLSGFTYSPQVAPIK